MFPLPLVLLLLLNLPLPHKFRSMLVNGCDSVLDMPLPGLGGTLFNVLAGSACFVCVVRAPHSHAWARVRACVRVR